MNANTCRIFAAALTLSAAASAQDQDVLRRKSDRLLSMCENMAKLESMTFETSLERDNAKISVRGTVIGDLLSATSADEQFVFRGRRMITRADDEDPWVVRHARGADGKPLPFILDPHRLFEFVRSSGASVTRAEVGTHKDRPVELYSVSFDGEKAVDLLWSDLLPDPNVHTNQADRIILVGGPIAGFTRPKPRAIIDAVFVIDPALQKIVAIKSRVAIKDGNPGGIRQLKAGGFRVRLNGVGGAVQVAGANRVGPAEEAEEQEEQPDANEAPKWADGMPVRDLSEHNHARFDIKFDQHGKVEDIPLEPAAARALGLKSQSGK